MTYKEVLKNRIEHYINKIIELQKQEETYKRLSIDWVKTDKNIEYYKNMIEKTVEELIRIGE